MKKSPAAHHARPGLVGFVVAVSLDESEDRNLRSFHGRKEGEHPDDSRARAALDQIEERVNHFLSSYDDPSIIQLKRVPSTSAILGSMMPPIKHWSHSSLMSFLRNPLAWYKRYVEEVYDTPSSPLADLQRRRGRTLAVLRRRTRGARRPPTFLWRYRKGRRNTARPRTHPQRPGFRN